MNYALYRSRLCKALCRIGVPKLASQTSLLNFMLENSDNNSNKCASPNTVFI